MTVFRALFLCALLVLATSQETALLNDLDERDPCYFAYQLFQQLAISQQNLVSVITKLTDDVKGVQDEIRKFSKDIDNLKSDVQTLDNDVTEFKVELAESVSEVHDDVMDIKTTQEEQRNVQEQLVDSINHANNLIQVNISTKHDQLTDSLDTLSLKMTSMNDIVEIIYGDLSTTANKTLTGIGDVRQDFTKYTGNQAKFREDITMDINDLKETMTSTRKDVSDLSTLERELISQQLIPTQNLIRNTSLDILSSNHALQLQVQAVKNTTAVMQHTTNKTLHLMEDLAEDNRGSSPPSTGVCDTVQDTVIQSQREVIDHLQRIQNSTLLQCPLSMNISGGSEGDQMAMHIALGAVTQTLGDIVSSHTAIQSSLDHLTALVSYKLGQQVTPPSSPDPTTIPTVTPSHVVTPAPPQLPSNPNTPLLLPERPLDPWEPHPLNWYTEAPDSALRKACFIRVAVNQVSRRASVVVRAVSTQIQTPPEQPPPTYGEYWIRIRDRHAHLCLQYKCPGHVFDPAVPNVQINGVSTQVQVHFTGAVCTLREANDLVLDSVSSTSDGFMFLAVPDANYNSTYGIYTGTGSGQRMQTKAFGYCSSGDATAPISVC